ncbi:methionyl-tRNA formyltransferase [Chloroflexota bacterium]
MHGSSKPLPYGRGRSPINWSLIQGRNVFYTHLFQYKPGVDDGPIAGVRSFDINQYDTCLILHFKNTISMIELCVKYLPSLIDGSAKLDSQPKENATYYPKRSEEDGLIYWEDSTKDIYNLIRAVTKPFPGAFSYLDDDLNKKIYIWAAQPFDTKLDYKNAKPGEIVEVFYNGMFVAKTNDSVILVTESEGHNFTTKDIGKFLGDLNKPRKHWKDLPQ